MEGGLAAITGRMPGHAARATGGGAGEGPVTIGLDTTDVEIYGCKKRSVPITTRASRSAARTSLPGPKPRPS